MVATCELPATLFIYFSEATLEMARNIDIYQRAGRLDSVGSICNSLIQVVHSRIARQCKESLGPPVSQYVRSNFKVKFKQYVET